MITFKEMLEQRDYKEDIAYDLGLDTDGFEVVWKDEKNVVVFVTGFSKVKDPYYHYKKQTNKWVRKDVFKTPEQVKMKLPKFQKN